MIWIGAIFIGLVISILDIILFTKTKRFKTYLTVFVRDTLTVILTGCFVMKNVFGAYDIFNGSEHLVSYTWKFLGLILGVGVIFLIIVGFTKRIFKIEFCEPKSKGKSLVLKIVSVLLFALGVAAFTGTLWGKDAFGDLAPDQILINLNSPTEGTDVGVYISLFEGPVLTTAFLTVIFSIIVFTNYKVTYEKDEKYVTFIPYLATRIIATILAVSMFIGGCAFGIDKFQLFTLFNAYLVDSSYIEDNYVDPNQANITFPEQKRNLIHIYLESMENTFFSKEFGGYFDENLMPDLAELSKEVLDRKLLSLSNGELRRVLLARMWMENPEWIYFNDLFGGLDPEYRCHLSASVVDLSKRPGVKLAVRLAREDELLPEIPAFVYADKTFTQYAGKLPDAAAKPKFTKAELTDYEIVLLKPQSELASDLIPQRTEGPTSTLFLKGFKQ